MSKTVWVCGKSVEGVQAWEFQGVFSSEDLAAFACRTESYFIGPAIIDLPLPDDPVEWVGAYYPLITMDTTA